MLGELITAGASLSALLSAVLIARWLWRAKAIVKFAKVTGWLVIVAGLMIALGVIDVGVDVGRLVDVAKYLRGPAEALIDGIGVAIDSVLGSVWVIA